MKSLAYEAYQSLKKKVRESLATEGKKEWVLRDSFYVERALEEVPLLKKRYIRWYNREFYLLGVDNDGKKYWLEAPRWECNWYWSVGHVEVLSNQRVPQLSKDIEMHTHFDSLFLDGESNYIDGYKALFIAGVTLSDKEIWKLLEAMKCLYLLREYANCLHRKGTNIAQVDELKDIVLNPLERERLCCKAISQTWEVVRNLLTDGNDDGKYALWKETTKAIKDIAQETN